MAAGAFWFSVMAALVKTAGRRLPSQEIVLVRGVITLALSAFMVWRAGVPPFGERRGLLVLRGVFGEFRAPTGVSAAVSGSEAGRIGEVRERVRADYPKAHRSFDAIIRDAQTLLP